MTLLGQVLLGLLLATTTTATSSSAEEKTCNDEAKCKDVGDAVQASSMLQTKSSAGRTEEDGHGVTLTDLKKKCKHPEGETSAVKWKALGKMAKTLNKLDAAWSIHAGTVLGLVRGCYVFDYDLDIALERKWLQKNYDKFEKAVARAGFTGPSHLGDIEKSAYEEKFHLSKLQYNRTLVSDLLNRGTVRLQEEGGVNVDIFTIERYDDFFTWSIWVGGKKSVCTVKATGTEPFSWLGVDVNVPVPLEDALISLYGKKYMTPRPWTWNKEPFTVGSCKMPKE